jgi:UDP-N-acetylglucosamine/UDP-N-acetyl-alpha-D-glucosaminouronate 4-epimerase
LAKSSRTYLVTGGAGFIGSHLAEALLARGDRVRVLDDLSTGRRANLPSGSDLEFLEGDIRDFQTCLRAASGCAGVFHQAALGSVPRSVSDPATTFAVNVTGTLHVLLAARDAGVARVVYASSSSVYGNDAALPKAEERIGEPLSPYAASKRSGELLAQAFGHCYGTTTVGLRYFNVYGPRQDPDSPYAAVIPLFFKAALTGRPATVFGDGEQTRDFTYVADVVQANLSAMDVRLAPATGVILNIGGGRRTSVNQLWKAVSQAAGRAASVVHAPARPGDVRDSLADVSLARQMIGYSPEVGIEEGLRRASAYYCELAARESRAGSSSSR